jgi:hypothetical protein
MARQARIRRRSQNLAPVAPPDRRRCPPAPRLEEVAPGDRDAYQQVVRNRALGGSAGADSRYYAALLNSPPLAMLLSEGGRFFTTSDLRGTYTHAEREWVDQVVFHELRDNRIVGRHMLGAVANGVRPEAIKALRAGRDEELTRDEVQLAVYIRSVVHGAVTDKLFRGIVDRFGLRGAIEYTSFVCWLLMVLRNHQAFDVWYDGLEPPEHPESASNDEQIADLVERFIRGGVPLPPPKVSAAEPPAP